MAGMSLFTRNSGDLPGVHGDVRDGSRLDRALRRTREGDILAIDAPDLSHDLAKRIVEVKPAAVINAARFTTGAVPNFGPQLLVDSGVELVEDAGPELFDKLRDGRRGRLDEGKLYYGDRRVAVGTPVTMAELTASFEEARTGLVDRMEALSGNLVEFAAAESPLYVDGLGIPDLDIGLRGRKAVLVGPGEGHRRTLERLKHFIREYEPVLIGVDAGADTLVDLDHTPDLIIGDPQGIAAETLRCGARVVLPADPDGHATGLERIQDLNIGCVTFPALSDSAMDLALVFAAHHGAEMIVAVGAPLDVEAVFAAADAPGTPSALLSRLKAGPRLVDGEVVADLYRVDGTGFGVAWAVLAVLIAVAVILAIAGTNGDGSVTENLIDTWNSIALWFQGLFRR
ncbi:putative cytokinetic ring protein SteA [Corynebacterium sphenisci]|uniref:putative cytokinetic ring protein SteA n=1 Tax=Corynebacterium sphenisci TaxID=191493 RepID=UPI0026DEAF53|nr:putative cytokinetic ring protein SteA [Corynebacterium sphenisci]MDO5730097.1 putative cytokinetic ring protein SteA [Corynebacterium sphenisci]